jgi:hypothetical protein
VLLSPVPGNAPGAVAGKKKAKDGGVQVAATPCDEAREASFARQNEAEEAPYQPDEGDGAWERGPLKLSDFPHDAKGEILGCPMGQFAISERNDEGNGGRACFDRAGCVRCHRNGDCMVRMTKKFAYLAYHDEKIRIAARRAMQETREFMEIYRNRSGVEATNSQLSKVGLKRVPVRGLLKATCKVQLKALAINIKRINNFEKQQAKLKVSNSN